MPPGPTASGWPTAAASRSSALRSLAWASIARVDQAVAILTSLAAWRASAARSPGSLVSTTGPPAWSARPRADRVSSPAMPRLFLRTTSIHWEIHSTARRHRVPDQDISHAYETSSPGSNSTTTHPATWRPDQIEHQPPRAGHPRHARGRARDPRHGPTAQHPKRVVWRREPMTDRIYGYTNTGKPIDDRLIEGLADEAERGYDPEQLRTRPRGRGRPPLGDAAKEVESVRPQAKDRSRQHPLRAGEPPGGPIRGPGARLSCRSRSLSSLPVAGR